MLIQVHLVHNTMPLVVDTLVVLLEEVIQVELLLVLLEEVILVELLLALLEVDIQVVLLLVLLEAATLVEQPRLVLQEEVTRVELLVVDTKVGRPLVHLGVDTQEPQVATAGLQLKLILRLRPGFGQ